MIVLTLAGVALAIHQLFNLQAFGVVMVEGRYLYLLGGLFLAQTFLCFRARTGADPAGALVRLDPRRARHGLRGLLRLDRRDQSRCRLGICRPDAARYVSMVAYLLILEGTRRAGGLTLFIIVVFFSIYPTFADHMPNPLSGFSQPFWDTVPYHIISAESSFGIPMKAFGNLVIGFILFGAVLQRTGGGQFFNDLALALVGRFRGGAAKVAIFASGFMGSMSGSVISNVLTTGAVSIPAMKKHRLFIALCRRDGSLRLDRRGSDAARSWARPPSSWPRSCRGPMWRSRLLLPYPRCSTISGLFAQIDAYAARRGLRGLTPKEVPSLLAAVKDGWLYLFVFGLLIFMMVVLRQDTLAPFYATGLLLLINQLLKKHRFTWSTSGDLIAGVGRALAELTAVLLGVGLIVGSFSATGLGGHPGQRSRFHGR